MMLSKTHLDLTTAELREMAREVPSLEVSVVMPCLNEADTLETCIEKAQQSLREHNITGEIIVSDNGSTDGSQSIAAYMSLLFSIFTKTFAISEGLIPEDRLLTRFSERINLERGLIIASVALLAGIVLLIGALNQWRLSEFGRLDYARTMRWVIPGATLTALGFQTILSSFFVSILGLRRR